MAVVERTYTAEDLLTLSHAPEYDEQRLELSDGERQGYLAPFLMNMA